MTEIKIKRNDPCNCGSGKKYKKCCGKSEAISITQLLEQEVKGLQSQIIDFALTHYDEEIERDFEGKLNHLVMEDQDEVDFFMMIHTIWFALFKPLQDGRTILEVFTEGQGKRIQRSRLKEILYSWENVRPIAGRITSFSTTEMTIQDALTDESHTVKLIDEDENEEASFLFGIIIPFGQETIFFTTYFDLENSDGSNDEQYLKMEFEESGYDDAVQFLKDNFLFLMNNILYSQASSTIEWDEPVYKEVAEIFQEEMKKKDEIDIHINVGIMLWKQFCELRQKNIKKPAVYAAALEYIINSVHPLRSSTKKEVAESYNVSAATMSKVISELREVLADQINKLEKAIHEDITESLNDPRNSEIIGENVIPLRGKN